MVVLLSPAAVELALLSYTFNSRGAICEMRPRDPTWIRTCVSLLVACFAFPLQFVIAVRALKHLLETFLFRVVSDEHLLMMQVVGAGVLALLGSLCIGIAIRGRATVDDGRLCDKCGYNLTGLPEPRCPECGKPFTRRGTLEQQSGDTGTNGKS